MISFGVVLLLAAQATPGVANWQWDTTSPVCAVQQENGSETIKISRTPANEETVLEISVPKRGGDREERIPDASLDLSPGKSPASVYVLKQGKKLKVYAATQDPGFIEPFSNASVLVISGGSIQPLELPVSSARVAVGALKACEDRKMAAWGIDPVAWRGLKSRPIAIEDPRERFTELDYPEDALRAHVEFDAIIRLDVATDGTVEKCRGLNPGSYKGFETASCAVLTKAKFHPAIDSAGNPVIAPIVYDVIFRIAT
jgi:TonB family protein